MSPASGHARLATWCAARALVRTAPGDPLLAAVTDKQEEDRYAYAYFLAHLLVVRAAAAAAAAPPRGGGGGAGDAEGTASADTSVSLSSEGTGGSGAVCAAATADAEGLLRAALTSVDFLDAVLRRAGGLRCAREAWMLLSAAGDALHDELLLYVSWIYDAWAVWAGDANHALQVQGARTAICIPVFVRAWRYAFPYSCAHGDLHSRVYAVLRVSACTPRVDMCGRMRAAARSPR